MSKFHLISMHSSNRETIYQEFVVKEKKYQVDLQSANDAAQARAEFVIQQAAARKASLEQTIEGTY